MFCAIMSVVSSVAGTGQLLGWGSAALPASAPGTRFSKFAAGWTHGLAVGTDGKIAAWGINFNLEAVVEAKERALSLHRPTRLQSVNHLRAVDYHLERP